MYRPAGGLLIRRSPATARRNSISSVRELRRVAEPARNARRNHAAARRARSQRRRESADIHRSRHGHQLAEDLHQRFALRMSSAWLRWYSATRARTSRKAGMPLFASPGSRCHRRTVAVVAVRNIVRASRHRAGSASGERSGRSGRGRDSSRSTLTLTNNSFITAAVASSSNDSWPSRAPVQAE